jgi:hypothetical protein
MNNPYRILVLSMIKKAVDDFHNNKDAEAGRWLISEMGGYWYADMLDIKRIDMLGLLVKTDPSLM